MYVPMIRGISIRNHVRLWSGILTRLHKVSAPVQASVMSTKVLVNIGRVRISVLVGFGKPNTRRADMFLGGGFKKVVAKARIHQPLAIASAVLKIVIDHLEASGEQDCE
jgi:hypothetical protein